MLPVESRAGGVPGELWPAGKCSQILLLMPFKPKEPWEVPKKLLSDWLGCGNCAERNGEWWALIGGEGEGDLKGEELLREPGMLTGAELCN